MLADVNTALHTIPTVSNTETNELIYIATVILAALGYNIKHACRESSPWRRRLEGRRWAHERQVLDEKEGQ